MKSTESEWIKRGLLKDNDYFWYKKWEDGRSVMAGQDIEDDAWFVRLYQPPQPGEWYSDQGTSCKTEAEALALIDQLLELAE